MFKSISIVLCIGERYTCGMKRNLITLLFLVVCLALVFIFSKKEPVKEVQKTQDVTTSFTIVEGN